MKVIVLGAGVVGVTTAYFLARCGYQVTVIDKNQGPALGCSYANGAQLSYSHVETWAAKASLLSISTAVILPNSFLSLGNIFDRRFFSWLKKFYQNSPEEIAKENSRNLFHLASFSREALAEIIKEEKIEFNYKKEGILHFFTNQTSFDKAVKETEFHTSLGCRLQILNADQCVEKEPSLIKLFNEKKLTGGIFYEDDAIGDSLMFTQNLAKICRDKYGVNFEFNTEIRNLLTNRKKITGINTDKGVFVGDKYVYSLGAEGDKLLSGIGINSNIYPLKGYSISMTVGEESVAPETGLTDIKNRAVYSRIGNVFRAAGTIEIAKLSTKKNKKNIRFLKNILIQNFSNFGDISQAQEWCGFRPFRPNSLPLVCEVKRYGNLTLNVGHGSLGWTLSSGCAKIVANLFSNNTDNKFSFLEEEGENL